MRVALRLPHLLTCISTYTHLYRVHHRHFTPIVVLPILLLSRRSSRVSTSAMSRDSDVDDSDITPTAIGGANVTSDPPATSSDTSHHKPPSAAAPVSLHAGFRQATKRRTSSKLPPPPPPDRKQRAKDMHYFLQKDPKDPNSRCCTLCL